MTDESSRWPLVKEVFDAALARPPHERAEFLRVACDEDMALREEVESLLAAHAQAGAFAERPAIDALSYGAPVGRQPTVPVIEAGFEFGPYRIVEPLDAGAMGEVYRAHDTRLGREVAVKVLPSAFSRDPARVMRLEQEARLLAAVNHSHIATIYGLEVCDGVIGLVMELIEGPTLADHLAHGPLGVRNTLELACQIAEALEAAHGKGIIHLDLKPANIKLTATGTIKVLDFGLAKITAEHLHTAASGRGLATEEGVIAGTPAYMSPEQARGERVDKRSDVWAFGCVLYEMLTGDPPFGRGTLDETLAAVLEREPSWMVLPSALPESIRRLLRRCLEKDPRRRLHDLADARIEIEDALHESTVGSLTVVASPDPQRAIAFAILATLLIGLALTAALLYRRAPTNSSELRVDISTPAMPDPGAFAISPDGRQIVFAAADERQIRIWLRRLDRGAAQPLLGSEGARAPFWSPDGRFVGFFAGSELKRIELRNGTVQIIANIVGGTAATWAADGTILFSSTTTPSLLRVNASGGPVQTVTMPMADSTTHGYPQFLQGGPDFLFFVSGLEAVRGAYLRSLGPSESTRLLATDGQARYWPPDWLVFVRQGALLAQRFDLRRRTLSGEPVVMADTVAVEPLAGAAAFSTSDAGVLAYRAGASSATRLTWFDRSGTVLGTIGSAEQPPLSDVTLSSDGHRVAAERTVRDTTDLWLVDSTRETRFTRGPAASAARFPVWSPDGRRIAFEKAATNSVRLSAKASAGGDEEEVLFESPETKVLCDWSSDGQFLIYYVPDPQTGTDLWVLPLQGPRVPFVFLQTRANELWGQFSPDGRWVAYQSNETGRFEIYVRPFRTHGGGQTLVSTEGGVYPRWSHDGKQLYYIAPDATMMVSTIQTAATTVEASVPTPLFQTRKVGRGLNVISRGHQYDVSPDGHFLINVEADATPTPITLLMHWKP